MLRKTVCSITSRTPAGQRRVIGGEFFSRGPSGKGASSYGEQGDAHAVSTVTLNKEYAYRNKRTVYSTIPFPSFLDNTLILQQYLFPLCYNKHVKVRNRNTQFHFTLPLNTRNAPPFHCPHTSRSCHSRCRCHTQSVDWTRSHSAN